MRQPTRWPFFVRRADTRPLDDDAEIVSELDKNILGQGEAKRAVATDAQPGRRQQVPSRLRAARSPRRKSEIGANGVGKTGSRDASRGCRCAFVKVEATKFTEVGYVGRDVDTIVRDLVEVAVKQTRETEMRKVRDRAADAAEERVLDVLIPPAREINFSDLQPADSATRQKFRKMLREGQARRQGDRDRGCADALADADHGAPGMEDLTSQLQGMFQQLSGGRRRAQKMKVSEAVKALTEEAGQAPERRGDQVRALASAEQNGIVFLDEIDKITSRDGAQGIDVSRQGVQRDLLPLVEGTTVTTKYGMLRTDHVLFIASGAFHLSKPSDLIPELQGRFPIRVELSSLSVEDFEKILVATDACLTRQYEALLATENVTGEFKADGIRRLAEIAYSVNERQENIGARRLYTVMERLLEDVSFRASKLDGANIAVDAAFVDERLAGIAGDDELAKYIL